MALMTPSRDPSDPTSVATATFSTKRKGFDPDEVRSFLVAVGGEIERMNERIDELVDALAAATEPVTDLSGLDEAAAEAAVGEEAARVLRSAREDARLIVERAEEAAARHGADAALAAERVVREATEAARRERNEVKARLREMIDEAERHVERVRMRAERSRESARIWAMQAEHAQREVANEFERARQAAADVIASLVPQSLSDDLDEVEPAEATSPVVDDIDESGPVQIPKTVVIDGQAHPDETEHAGNDDPDNDDGDEGLGGQVVHLFGDHSVVDVDPGAAATDADVDLDVDVSEPSTRDIALVRILPRVIRRAKRTFTDEQKLILVALDGASVTDVADLIPGPDEHAATHSSVLRRDLEAAAAAGVDVLGGELTDDAVDLTEALSVVATAIAGEIRSRLEAIIAEAAGDNEAIATSVRAMYRDLRRDVVEPRVTDAVLHAYSAGMIAAAPSGSAWRWIASAGTEPCPECEDNALAGLVEAGAPFPTGHLAPPAHLGCRCDLEVNRR
jgi:cell division septum initiation protein DivIVA